jgi:hypothetical protein
MISVEKNPNIDLLLVMGPSHITLAIILLIIRRILGKKNSWGDLFMFIAKGYIPIFVVEN